MEELSCMYVCAPHVKYDKVDELPHDKDDAICENTEYLVQMVSPTKTPNNKSQS